MRHRTLKPWIVIRFLAILVFLTQGTAQADNEPCKKPLTYLIFHFPKNISIASVDAWNRVRPIQESINTNYGDALFDIIISAFINNETTPRLKKSPAIESATTNFDIKDFKETNGQLITTTDFDLFFNWIQEDLPQKSGNIIQKPQSALIISIDNNSTKIAHCNTKENTINTITKHCTTISSDSITYFAHKLQTACNLDDIEVRKEQSACRQARLTPDDNKTIFLRKSSAKGSRRMCSSFQINGAGVDPGYYTATSGFFSMVSLIKTTPSTYTEKNVVLIRRDTTTLGVETQSHRRHKAGLGLLLSGALVGSIFLGVGNSSTIFDPCIPSTVSLPTYHCIGNSGSAATRIGFDVFGGVGALAAVTGIVLLAIP